MTATLIPNLEAVIGDWLRDHPYLDDFDARVAGKLPDKQSEQVKPWVKVAMLDATDAATAEYLISYLMQFDCYASRTAMEDHAGPSEASLLARSVRAALKDAQGQTTGDTVISSVTFSGMAHLPDPDYEPARERYVLTATIAAHGVPA